jgi:hypothetical protein
MRFVLASMDPPATYAQVAFIVRSQPRKEIFILF